MKRAIDDGTTIVSRIRKGTTLLESSLNVLAFDTTIEYKLEVLETRIKKTIEILQEAEKALIEKINTISNCL